MGTLFVDNIKQQSSQGSGTITLGASGETIALASGASVTGNGLVGITMTDSWRITTSTNESTDADVTTNWEKNDTTGHTNIGTGLTESSGIFSFPQTGFYYIDYSFTIQTNTDSSAEITLKVTFNNSSYTNFSEAFSGAPTQASGAANQTCSNTNFINVTNISNVKFKFSTGSFGSGTKIIGNTSEQRAGFSIIRLGDSV